MEDHEFMIARVCDSLIERNANEAGSRFEICIRANRYG